MKNLSKFLYVFLSVALFVLISAFFLLHTTYVSATLEAPEGKVEDPDPKPEFRYPCSSPGLDHEFHSLRPYQAAPCGGAALAKFCSNELIFIEEFDLARKGCNPRRVTEDWTCDVNAQVGEHDLYIELSGSELPILGNTEQVTNSFGGTEEFDDPQKLNEYTSWYLSGVNTRAEYGEPTNDQIVNFSGPLNKLYPQVLQEAERINTINKASSEMFFRDETGTGEDGTVNEALSEYENHNQIVVCADEKFGIFGNVVAKPCPEGEKFRLNDWLGDLSFLRGIINSIKNYFEPLIDNVVGGDSMGANVVTDTTTQDINDVILQAWNKRYPPLPWADENGKPFKTDIEYRKAYAEWQGKMCAIIFNRLFCIDNPLVTNKYADLYHYIPLSSTADKKGSNYIKGDGPSYDAAAGTVIENAMHKSFSGAPLYFAHTQETKELSQLLNNTFTPMDTCVSDCMALEGKILKQCRLDCEKKRSTTSWPKDVENITKVQGEDCSLANVRVNQGDNLFAGNKFSSPREMWVKGVQYKIKQVECHEEYWKYDCMDDKTGLPATCTHHVFNCPAYIKISIKTGTKIPNANEIFTQTVAGEQSTFRRIFPKVGKGAPVECIADIPTSTDVYYDPTLSDYPETNTGAKGDNTFKVNPKPDDTPNDVPQLTFPHFGSVYEYFLKGIQTALRPKGYGEPIANGNCKPTTAVECGDWETKLEKSSDGDCGICNSELGDLAKRILATAGKAYNVPAAAIWATMKHEGGDWDEFRGQFTDENVRKWSNTIECGGEPMPSCDNSIQETQPPFGFLMNWFYNDAGADTPWSSVQKIDSSRNSKDKVSRCNFLDAAFAAANVLSQTSAIYANGVTSCGKNTAGKPYVFDNTRPGTCSPTYWNDNHIAQSLTNYAGYCVDNDPNKLYTTQQAVGWFKDAKCN